jgi:gluconolactonase
VNVEIRDARFASVVGPDVSFQKLATGFLFTEGPIWNPKESYLVFSDIPGSHVRKWSDASGISTLRQPSNMTNA